MTPRIPATAAVVALILGFALTAMAEAEDTSSRAAPPAGYRTVFEDGFDGATIDPKWTALWGTWRSDGSALLSSLPVLLRPAHPVYTPIASPAERPLGLSPAPTPNVAAMTAAVPIPDAFRIALVIAGRGVAPATINMGPYLGEDAGSGYRLVYDGEFGNPLKLKFARGGQMELVAAADPSADLYDGNPHAIVWTRDRLGRMSVTIDGENALSGSDRGKASGFDGFSIVNTGGSWTIDTVSIQQPDE
jgi:hypothetical protein